MSVATIGCETTVLNPHTDKICNQGPLFRKDTGRYKLAASATKKGLFFCCRVKLTLPLETGERPSQHFVCVWKKGMSCVWVWMRW